MLGKNALHLGTDPVVVAPISCNSGYRLVAADGGVFAFDAPFVGSMAGRPLNKPVRGMVRVVRQRPRLLRHAVALLRGRAQRVRGRRQLRRRREHHRGLPIHHDQR